MIKIATIIFLLSFHSLAQGKLGINSIDKQIQKFSLLQVYTNKLFNNIKTSSHLSKKGKKFLGNKLISFQKNELDNQRLKIESIIKNYHALSDTQKSKLSRYFKDKSIKQLMNKRSQVNYDQRFEHFLMKVNLNKVPQKKMNAISNFTNFSNTHSKEFNLELAKLKNLYLLKDTSIKKINKLTSYMKDPQLSKIITIAQETLSFSEENYSLVNSRFKRIQKKSVSRQLASRR